MDNVQKHNTCNNIPSSQTFKSYRKKDAKMERTIKDHNLKVNR
jgi:hypothetical protein